jgi:pyruvate,orthophosphate dikinase
VHILARQPPVETVAAPEPASDDASDFGFTPQRFAVLRALRLKGQAAPDTLATATRVPVESIGEDLAAASAADLCRPSGSLWQLTSDGFDWVQQHLVHERPDVARAEALHATFLPVNARFKQLAFDWQMRDPQTFNDHQDAAYDAAVLARLETLHAEITPVAAQAAALVPRLQPYAQRFDAAIARIRSGEHRFLMSPVLDSYHTVWFEFHEELIGMTGRTRAHEAAAGRAS